MDKSEEAYLRELLETHKKRLNILELRSAREGRNCPPEVVIEIEEIRKESEELSRRIESDLQSTMISNLEFFPGVTLRDLKSRRFTTRSILCGHCGTRASMVILCDHSYNEPVGQGHFYTWKWEVLECAACNSTTVFEHLEDEYTACLYPNVIESLKLVSEDIKTSYITVTRLRDADLHTFIDSIIRLFEKIFASLDISLSEINQQNKNELYYQHSYAIDIVVPIMKLHNLLVLDNKIKIKRRKYLEKLLIQRCKSALDYISTYEMQQNELERLIKEMTEPEAQSTSRREITDEDDLPF